MIRHILRVALLAIFLAFPAQAEPDRVSVLLGSAHVGATGFDGRNPGVFLTWEDRGPFDLSGGLYRNSYGKVSVAGTLALPVARWAAGDLSVFAGLAHYPGDGRRFAVHWGDIVPIGGLQLRQGNIFLHVIPGDGEAVDAVIAAGLTFPLK